MLDRLEPAVCDLNHTYTNFELFSKKNNRMICKRFSKFEITLHVFPQNSFVCVELDDISNRKKILSFLLQKMAKHSCSRTVTVKSSECTIKDMIPTNFQGEKM